MKKTEIRVYGVCLSMCVCVFVCKSAEEWNRLEFPRDITRLPSISAVILGSDTLLKLFPMSAVRITVTCHRSSTSARTSSTSCQTQSKAPLYMW